MSVVKCSHLGCGSEDGARDGESPVDMAEVLGHDGESTALGVSWWSHNTLEGGHVIPMFITSCLCYT